jgi:hypothetical protein
MRPAEESTHTTTQKPNTMKARVERGRVWEMRPLEEHIIKNLGQVIQSKILLSASPTIISIRKIICTKSTNPRH